MVEDSIHAFGTVAVVGKRDKCDGDGNLLLSNTSPFNISKYIFVSIVEELSTILKVAISVFAKSSMVMRNF